MHTSRSIGYSAPLQRVDKGSRYGPFILGRPDDDACKNLGEMYPIKSWRDGFIKGKLIDGLRYASNDACRSGHRHRTGHCGRINSAPLSLLVERRMLDACNSPPEQVENVALNQLCA